MGSAAWMVAAAVAAVLASWAFNALVYLAWRPYAVTRRLRAQGVRGPGYAFLTGNLLEIKRLLAAGASAKLDVADHDFVPIVHPHIRQWIRLYGKTFLYWFGARPNLCVADVGAVRQVLSDRTGLFPKDIIDPQLASLLGKGLVVIDGDDWKRHHQVVHPAFNMDKLKMMRVTMSECAQSMLSDWEAQMHKGGGDVVEMELSSRFEELTANVISHTAFGSSYREGKQVYLAQRELQNLLMSTILNVQIPGFRYLPTKNNLRTWELDKKVRGILMGIINTRLAAKDTAGYGTDLLGLMLEACEPEHGRRPLLSMDEIVDECKTFFFGGQDTTSHVLTWAAFLLSTRPEWQHRLREEVRRECGAAAAPTSDELSRLRLVNMFLLETLRLYSPLTLINRRAGADLDIGGVRVPEGTIVTIPIAIIHRDEEVWGEDAGAFRPERFENGVTRAARHPNALLAFSAGPRSCIGQNFAMMEMKAVIAMIMQRFSLELSPKYVHSPMDVLTLRPRYGLPIILRRLKM